MIRKIGLVLVVLVGFLPVIYVARYQPPAVEDPPEGAIELVYSSPANPEIQAAFEQVFRIFHRENPDITVKMLPSVSAGFEQRIQTQMLAGKAPDIFFFQNEIYPDWAQEGLFYDLTEFAVNDPEFDSDAFFPQCMEEAWLDGRLYGLPLNCGASVIFYNKDLFAEYGVEYNDETWDWIAFLDAAKTLTRDTDGDGRVDIFGVQMVDNSEWSYPFVWMSGGRVLSEDKSRCVIHSPEAIAGLQWLTDIWNVHQIQLTSFVGAGGEAVTSLGDPFVEGKVAMKFSGPYYCDSLQLATRYNWGIAKFPRHPETGLRVTRFYQDFNVVWSKTEHPEAAWKLLRFLTGPVGQRMMAHQGNLPSRVEIAYSDAFIRDDTPWDEKRLVDAIADAETQPIGRDYYYMRKQADQAFEQMIARNPSARIGVAEALAELEETVNRRFRQLERGRSETGEER